MGLLVEFLETNCRRSLVDVDEAKGRPTSCLANGRGEEVLRRLVGLVIEKEEKEVVCIFNAIS